MAEQQTTGIKKGRYFYANGKRKTAVARLRLYPHGNGEITINDKTINQFCKTRTHIDTIRAPLRLTGHLKDFDIIAKVQSGGTTAQAEAVRHGIAKALLEANPLLRVTLKKAGFITRDSRMKERKKYGKKRARRSPQWSKR